jgi:hypothetical protein
MSSELENPYRPPATGSEPTAPPWGFVWAIAVLGAALGFIAVLVSSGNDVTWLLAWPFIPLVAVAAERWRRRERP